jgi:hypothetical protein
MLCQLPAFSREIFCPKSCGLAVISRSGYQTRVERDFDSMVLRRLLAALETYFDKRWD